MTPPKAARRDGGPRLQHIQIGDIAHTEVVTANVAGTKAFYERTFGWKFQNLGPDMGNYEMATLPNGMTYGLRAPQPGNAGDKPGVVNYTLVPDVKKAVADAKKHGAQVMLEPQEVPGKGWFAICLVQGTPHGVWQVMP